MSDKNIDRLLEAVKSTAEFRAQSIRREVDAAEAAALKAYRESLRRSAESSRRRSESRAADESAEVSAEGAAKIRRRLYSHRDEITGKVFARVEKEVRDFSEGEKYLPRLLELAAEAARAVEGKGGAALLLRPADEKYGERVKETTGLPVRLCDSITLGGVIGVCDELTADLSFDEGLRCAMADFAKESGLRV